MRYFILKPDFYLRAIGIVSVHKAPALMYSSHPPYASAYFPYLSVAYTTKVQSVSTGSLLN